MSAKLPGDGRRSLKWFIVVGCVAAGVHWIAVVALVESAAWRPLWANLIGWLLALGFSFSGHHRLTFRGHGSSVPRSARRFFAVSATGFTINELAYAALLRWSGQRYDLLLALVLVVVAWATWWLSRHWVFLRDPDPP